jgi:hypothetical protein
VIDFVINKLVRYFPKALWEICGDDLLEKNIKKRNKKNVPVFAYWMHWFHAQCITDAWDNPPFDPEWPVEGCNKKLGNKDNKTDTPSVKAREKAYSQSEARRAEANEIDQLFDF